MLRNSLLFFILFLHPVANAAQNMPPDQLIQTVAETTFSRILNEQSQIDASKQHLQGIIEQELMPHVNHQFAAFKVLGNHFKKVPQEEIKEFVDVFRNYLITRYASVLAEYKGQKVEFSPAKLSASQKESSVNCLISEPGEPDINLAFKLRKSSSGRWQVYDIVAEGISLVASKRSEFGPIIRTQGIQTVIDSMR
jgi:phospholipid transport system substrate-binding protein